MQARSHEPSSTVSFRTEGQQLPSLLDREYHMIAPRLARIDYDQLCCAEFVGNAYFFLNADSGL
jgi:hypothetical protein